MSDELGMLAHPRPALSIGREATIAAIARMVEDEEVGEIIVGLPVTLAGGESAETRQARAFIASLRAAVDVPVREWDERYSSREADQRLGKGRDRASGVRDSVAAAIVLQAVLDSRRGAGR